MNRKLLLTILLGLTLLSVSARVFAATDAQIKQGDDLNTQATTLEQQANAYAASGNPALEAQVSGLRAQAAALRAQAKALIGGGDTAVQTPPANAATPQQNEPFYKLIVPIPGLSETEITNPLDYVKGIYNFGIGFGMLVAVAIIVFAGLKWTTSAGNPSAQSEAKDMILNAVFGIVMLLSAILILRTIDPKLTTLSLPKLTPIGKSDFGFGSALLDSQLKQLDKDYGDAHQSYQDAQAKARAAEKACADEVAKTGKCSKATMLAEKQAQLAEAQAKTKQDVSIAALSANRAAAATKALSDCINGGLFGFNLGCGDEEQNKKDTTARAEQDAARVEADRKIEANLQTDINNLQK